MRISDESERAKGSVRQLTMVILEGLCADVWFQSIQLVGKCRKLESLTQAKNRPPQRLKCSTPDEAP